MPTNRAARTTVAIAAGSFFLGAFLVWCAFRFLGTEPPADREPGDEEALVAQPMDEQELADRRALLERLRRQYQEELEELQRELVEWRYRRDRLKDRPDPSYLPDTPPPPPPPDLPVWRSAEEKRKEFERRLDEAREVIRRLEERLDRYAPDTPPPPPPPDLPARRAV